MFKGERVEVESVTDEKLVNQSCLWNGSLHKTPMDRVWRASGLVNIWGFRKRGILGKIMEALCLFLIPCPMLVFHLAVPFIINQ